MSDENPETAASAASGEDRLSVTPVEEATCPACGAKADVSGIEPFSRIACPSCGAELDVPGRLGHFLLLRRLGSGGMGTTFLAEDETLGRKCAVKVMQKAVGTDEGAFAAFKNEAQSAARLNHPHVAQIYSFGKEGDNPYLAMELVPGGDLAGLAAKTGEPLDPAFVMRVGLEIAEGLQAAEEAGLHHGDVKPDNILFDETGAAKLVDFGIASRSTKGAADELWGTPFYIAPEKVQLKKDSAKSDIYSLGATLYHAIAGRPPYDGPDAVAVIKARFEAPPEPLESIRPDVDPEVRRIVSRMMDIDYKLRRYPSYKSLIADISKYLEGIPAERKAGPLYAVQEAARGATGAITAKTAEDASSGAADAPGGKKKIVIHKRGGRPRPAAPAADASSPVPQASSGARLVPDEKKSGVNAVKAVFFGVVGLVAILILCGVGFLVSRIRASAATEKRATAMVEEAKEVAARYFGLADALEAGAQKVAAVDAEAKAPINRIAKIVREATGEDWALPDIEPPAPSAAQDSGADAEAAQNAAPAAPQVASLLAVKDEPVFSDDKFKASKMKLIKFAKDHADMATDAEVIAKLVAVVRDSENGKDADMMEVSVTEALEELEKAAAEKAAAAEAAPAQEEAAPAADEPAAEEAAPEAPPANPLLEPLERYVVQPAKAIRAAMREAERIALDETAQFEDLKTTFVIGKIERGLAARKNALAARESVLARIGALEAEASAALVELQKSVARIERLAKPLLAAKERAAAEEERRREAEEKERAAQEAAERRAAVEREEVERVQGVARTHWELLGKGQFDEFQRRMHRMDEELRTEPGREELDLTCRRAAALGSLREWIVKDLRQNGVLRNGFRNRFDIRGASEDGKTILLKGGPDVPIDKMNIGDWVNLFWQLLENRPSDRKGLRSFDRGEQLKNAAIYCYVFGQDEEGNLDDRALETCRKFADKALSYRSGLEREILRLVPPLAEPRPDDGENADDGDGASDGGDGDGGTDTAAAPAEPAKAEADAGDASDEDPFAAAAAAAKGK